MPTSRGHAHERSLRGAPANRGQTWTAGGPSGGGSATSGAATARTSLTGVNATAATTTGTTGIATKRPAASVTTPVAQQVPGQVHW